MIQFVVALDCEAKPLASRYQLRRLDSAFSIYQGDGIALVVSGVGKVAAAAATAYLYRRTGEPDGAVWLNVGIAGHRDRPGGDGVLASEIKDRGSNEVWRLRPIATPLATASVLTVDQAEERFDTDDVYEMEAAGFYATAIRFAPPEKVQCYKVISDNRCSSALRITAKDVEHLIEERIHEIDAAVEKTSKLTCKP